MPKLAAEKLVWFTTSCRCNINHSGMNYSDTYSQYMLRIGTVRMHVTLQMQLSCIIWLVCDLHRCSCHDKSYNHIAWIPIHDQN